MLLGKYVALRLSINASKTKLLIFSRPRFVSSSTPQLFVNGVQLEAVSSVRYLGVTLYSKLTYVSHTYETVAKVKRSFGYLCSRFRNSVSKAILSYFFVTLFRSVLVYAIEAYYPRVDYGRKAIEKCQKFACRLILRNYSRSVTYSSLLSSLNWQPVYKYVFVRRLFFVYSVASNRRFFPGGFFVLLYRSNRRHSVRTNHPLSLDLSCFRGKHSSTSVFGLSSVAFNALPAALFSLSTKQFVRALSGDDVFDHVMNSLRLSNLVVVSEFDF